MNLRSSLTRWALLGLLAAVAACGAGQGSSTAGAPTSESAAPTTNCEPGLLEADFVQPRPWFGPAVGSDGQLVTGGAELVVSSTYLQLRNDQAARARFDELNDPLFPTLQAQTGLLALAFAQSQTCGTLRTLAVWKDEAAMASFVRSPAHVRAAAAIRELSRGNSLVTHWKTSDVRDMTWSKAAQALAADPGPRY